MILITGPTGNVGKELVARLLDDEQDVRVLVRQPAKVAHLRGRVDVVEGDLDRPETLARAVDGVRSIYLIATETSQVASLLAAAKRAGVEQVVRQSTIEAGAAPPLGPGQWHRAAEALIEESGLAWTHLRPTMMMVNTAGWWAASIQSQGCVFFPAGDGRVSPVAPRDVAAVAATVLTQPGHAGRAYDVTGPEVLSIGEMVGTLARVLSKPIRYQDVPESAAAAWLGQAGLPAYVVAGLVETLGALRRSEYAYVSDTVVRLTGRPEQTYEAWCREHVNLFTGKLDLK